jgi:hypothetical protein
MNYFKKFDFYGKNISFFYGSSTIHRTIFGGLLSLFTFSLMTGITIFSLYNFLYQKPVINSNVVFFINKKFAELKGMEIKGQLTMDIQEDMINNYININGTYNQLDDFLQYYRIVLHEKYFEEVEKFHVANIVRLNNSDYQFNVEMHISDVFKEKEFSSLKIISCEELLRKERNVIWPKIDSIEKEDISDFTFEKNNEFDNSPEMCFSAKQKYFENVKKYNLENIDFVFSFDTPIYTVDRKGDLYKSQHFTRLSFNVKQNYLTTYSMDTNYVIIEDDSNIYYTKKKYDAYFTMKHPMIIDEENKENNDFKLNIDLKNENNNQIILISIYKYKMLDFLTKLGGIMKIITIMKMTCTFWSSYFYEKTLYKLIVKRKNPYLEQKKLLLEPTFKNIASRRIMNNFNEKKFDPETSSMRSQPSVNYNYTLNNFNSNIGPFALPDKNNKNNNINDEYCSYFAWIMNKFCKVIYLNKEARRKKLMITDTLGLSNYLLHLDYIDRQIILEQKTGEINNKIKEILSKSNNSDESRENNDSLDVNLNLDNVGKSSETETDNFKNIKKEIPLIENEQ